jgi:plastocyanin
MTDHLFRLVFIVLLLLAATAATRAGTLQIDITDSRGQPAANSVVALTPLGNTGAAVSRLPTEAVIDQRKETFIPLVTVVRQGGHVIFTNHDTTMHQVYSFSPIKQFEFEIDQGHRSEPVVFENAGVASIGCNIHDHMITYVYVAAVPWAALTDSKGHAEIADIPNGKYRAEIWHPQLLPGRPAPSELVEVNGTTKLAIAVPLLAAAPMKHMHMGTY